MKVTVSSGNKRFTVCDIHVSGYPGKSTIVRRIAHTRGHFVGKHVYHILTVLLMYVYRLFYYFLLSVFWRHNPHCFIQILFNTSIKGVITHMIFFKTCTIPVLKEDNNNSF